MSDAPSARPTGADLARAWFEHSPFVRHLSLELVALEPERARVRLPFADTLPTAGDVIHGGAISTLIDTAAALAAWSAHDPSQGVRWGTVSMTVSFEAAARGHDVLATAEVTRRGKTLCFISVAVDGPADKSIAHALVTYRLG
jgi:uncharacterized protein (TIGR00369 family)